MHLKKEVIWKEQKYGSMLYNVRTEEKLKLNETATMVFLSRFVTHHGVGQIVEVIKKKFPEAEELEIAKDVENTLDIVLESGMLTDDEDDYGYINLIRTNPIIEHVNLEVTRNCNLNCKHCMEGGAHETDELTLEEIYSLINEFAEMKVLSVVLTGGEPLMRKDLPEIIHRLTERNIKSYVFTNGTLIDKDFIKKIKDDNVLIRFSVDGIDADTHDYIRGDGNYAKTISAIKECVKEGIDTGISITVNKKNINQYFDIIKMCQELGVKEIEASEIVAKGNAKINKELMLEQPELEQLRINAITASFQSKEFRKGMSLHNMLSQDFDAEKLPKENSCNAAITSGFVRSNGNVYPCTLFADYPEFIAGNIKETHFVDIWNQSEVFKKLRAFKISDITACQGCEAFDKCPGGCRARAYMFSGKLDGKMEEDFCKTSLNLLHRVQERQKLSENK